MKENSPLVFKYEDIEANGGFSVKRTLDPAEYADLFDRPGTLKNLSLELDFSIGGDSILLEGRVSAELELECSRCTKPVTRSFEDAFDEVYADTVEYIDTREPVRETVGLLAPIKVLCSDACKGRCLVCGCDRNIKSCACKTVRTGSFDALKELKVDKPENPGKRKFQT